MRQAGFLAAAGIVALEKMTKRLNIDHENAKYLAKKLMEIPGIKLNPDNVHINMVFFDISALEIKSDALVAGLFAKGIKINGEEDGLMRFVTNNDVTREDIDYTIKCMKELI
jgi:threonine aldolase